MLRRNRTSRIVIEHVPFGSAGWPEINRLLQVCWLRARRTIALWLRVVYQQDSDIVNDATDTVVLHLDRTKVPGTQSLTVKYGTDVERV